MHFFQILHFRYRWAGEKNAPGARLEKITIQSRPVAFIHSHIVQEDGLTAFYQVNQLVCSRAGPGVSDDCAAPRDGAADRLRMQSGICRSQSNRTVDLTKRLKGPAFDARAFSSFHNPLGSDQHDHERLLLDPCRHDRLFYC